MDEATIFGFLGLNRAYKTTTIEILKCLGNPTASRATVLGYDVADQYETSRIKGEIRILPQNFNALDKLTVKENIRMFDGMYPNTRDADELIQLRDLADKSKTRFNPLSRGLKQHVGIVAAL